MKAYQDKKSGLWKWGTNGKPQYKSKHEAQNAGLKILTDALRRMRDKLNGHLLIHGK